MLERAHTTSGRASSRSTTCREQALPLLPPEVGRRLPGRIRRTPPPPLKFLPAVGSRRSRPRPPPGRGGGRARAGSRSARSPATFAPASEPLPCRSTVLDYDGCGNRGRPVHAPDRRTEVGLVLETKLLGLRRGPAGSAAGARVQLERGAAARLTLLLGRLERASRRCWRSGRPRRTDQQRSALTLDGATASPVLFWISSRSDSSACFR